jgi:hypothetical protein
MKRTLSIMVALLAMQACNGSSREDVAGRYMIQGRFSTTQEVPASSPNCGPPAGDRELSGSLAVGQAKDGRRSMYMEGPGCTVEATDAGNRLYLADGKECAIDPKGAYAILGVGRVLYRSFRADLGGLTWSYAADLTWPSTLFPEGTAKVCATGEARLSMEVVQLVRKR